MRSAVVAPAALDSQRVFQKPSLPEKNARFTPAARAFSIAVRCVADQYSSWPLEMKSLRLRSVPGRRCTSTPLT